MPMRPNPTAGVEGTPASEAQKGLTAGSASSSQSLASLSSTSISASAESFVAANGPVLADKQLLGLVVLMLTLKYLQSDDEEEKKGLMALIIALAQQQGAGGGESIMYSASSLSIESTQIQAVSSEAAISGYSGAAIDPQQTPPASPGSGSGGLDVVA